MQWMIIILSIVTNVAANVFLKMGTLPPHKSFSLNQPLAILGNWPLWLGLASYGAAFFLYNAALARFPMNVAHPMITSGAIATVALCSLFIFCEPFYWTTAVGIILIIAGVVLMTQHP